MPTFFFFFLLTSSHSDKQNREKCNFHANFIITHLLDLLERWQVVEVAHAVALMWSFISLGGTF